jgi:hypothetical protein
LPFPLDRSIYVDFTHENLMVAVFSAMGLFNVSKPLNPKKLPMDDDREWLASHMVPFSTRMAVERLRCPVDVSETKGLQATLEGRQRSALWNTDLMTHAEDDVEDARNHLSESELFVRILVNDELQPLEFCNNYGSSWQRKHGLCTLLDFVQSQGYARRSGDGDFEKCYN